MLGHPLHELVLQRPAGLEAGCEKPLDLCETAAAHEARLPESELAQSVGGLHELGSLVKLGAREGRVGGIEGAEKVLLDCRRSDCGLLSSAVRHGVVWV